MFYYMSFASPKLPKGLQFLGCTVVEAEDIIEATQKAWRLGINQGGEIMFIEIGEKLEDVPEDIRDMINRRVGRVEGMKRGICPND